MPDFSCSVSDISNSTTCQDRGGLLVVFATLDSSVDWSAMALSANYTSATNTIIDWAMFAGQYWAKFVFNRKTGRLDSTYTNETGYYDVQLLDVAFKGKTSARTISLGKLIGCCGLILQVFDNNNVSRVIGKEFVSGSWVNAISRGRVSRHLDTTGTFGAADDKSRDVVDFMASHSNPLAYSTVSIADMESLGEPQTSMSMLLGLTTTKILGLTTTKVLGKFS